MIEPMIERARDLLREVYGYADFRDTQEKVLAAALAGRDTLVLMPTGGGKSLCYQLPSIIRPGIGLVVSPLIALMQDQVNALRQLGVRAAFLNSTLAYGEQRRIVDEVRARALDMLYLAPERLLQEETLTLLEGVDLSLIAIDEAHCVSQWGHDFRQDYLGLDVLRDLFPGVPRMALTATADAATREDILARLAFDPKAERFVSGFDRPNIRYTVRAKTDANAQLRTFLDEHRDQAGIVYAMTRKKTEAIAAMLNARGFTALAYHAGLPGDVRAACQNRFLREDGVIVVATIAFGMGIDKPDVRFVAHVDLPKSVEAYYQETGRAGRDGEAAEAWMVYGLQDVVRLRQLADMSEADDQHKRIERGKLDALLGWCEVTTCRRRALLRHFDDDLPRDCGNCDVCLTPPETRDGTTAAQKLLSAIYRTGQRFGAGHVIDVLRGKDTEKIRQWGHERLSTYGIGADLSATEWRSFVRQLMVQGYIRADDARFGALRLTADARAVLRGDRMVLLRKDASVKPRARPTTQREVFTVDAKDQGLWETLRQCRRDLAEEAGVPPYVIFHDATLKEMLHRRPASLEEMLAIHGVGQAKLQRYGAAFLDALRGSLQPGSARGHPSEENSSARGRPSREESEPADAGGNSSQEEIREELSWPGH